MSLLDWLIKRINSKKKVDVISKAIIFGSIAIGSAVAISSCAAQEPSGIVETFTDEELSAGNIDDFKTDTSGFLDNINDKTELGEAQSPYQTIENKIVAMNKKILEPNINCVQALATVSQLRAELENVKLNCVSTEKNNATYEALKLNIETLEYDLCIITFTSCYDKTQANDYIKLDYSEQGKPNNISQTTLIDTEDSTWVAIAGDTYFRCTNNYLEKCNDDLSNYEDINSNPTSKDLEELYNTIINNIMNVGKDQVTYSNGKFTIQFNDTYACQFNIDSKSNLNKIVLTELQTIDGQQYNVTLSYTFTAIKAEEYNNAYNKVSYTINQAAAYARPENFLPR